MVDAGCAWRASRRADDLAHLDRFSYSYGDRRTLSVAGDPSSSARKFASAMAADHVRGRALAALSSGLADHDERLAFRLCTRLACFLVLRRAPPMLTSGNRALVKALDGWHQNFMWALLVVAGLHVAAAHLLYYRDGVMRRMLPGQPATAVPVKAAGRSIERSGI